MTHWDPDGAGSRRPMLVAGGIFTTAGGLLANRIAIHDGESWKPLGSGLNSNVRALAVDPSTNNLIVGGDFTQAGGATAFYLARCNGTSWTEMYSTNLAAGVYAMYISPNDDISVGTGWTNIWPGAGCAMFKWNTGASAWDNLGVYFDSGGNPYIWDCEPIPCGGGFSVGGRLQTFTLNNGASWNPIGFIARYGPPTPIITAHPQDAVTCPSGPAVLSVTATSSSPLTYGWKHNGVALSDEANRISGSSGPVLTLVNLTQADLGVYVCEVINSCGSTYSRDAFLGVSTCDCIDFYRDGLFPDTQDIEDFLSVFADGLCAGQSQGDAPCNIGLDFNNDGLYPDTLDIDALLSLFAGGPCL